MILVVHLIKTSNNLLPKCCKIIVKLLCLWHYLMLGMIKTSNSLLPKRCCKIIVKLLCLWHYLMLGIINFITLSLHTNISPINSQKENHRTPLVWWLLYKYEYLWGVWGKGRSSSLQEGASYTYSQKKKKKKD